MKHLIVLLPILVLAGCAHNVHKAIKYQAPSMTGVSVPLGQAQTAIKGSQKKASQLKPHVAPAGLTIWVEMTTQLEEANAKAANAEAALIVVEADTKLLERAANLESAARGRAEMKAETYRKEALNNGRERDFLVLIIAVGAALLGSAALMPTLRVLTLPLAATGWGGILILVIPFLLPLVLGAGAFWAARALLAIVRNIIF